MRGLTCVLLMGVAIGSSSYGVMAQETSPDSVPMFRLGLNGSSIAGGPPDGSTSGVDDNGNPSTPDDDNDLDDDGEVNGEDADDDGDGSPDATDTDDDDDGVDDENDQDDDNDGTPDASDPDWDSDTPVDEAAEVPTNWFPDYPDDMSFSRVGGTASVYIEPILPGGTMPEGAVWSLIGPTMSGLNVDPATGVLSGTTVDHGFMAFNVRVELPDGSARGPSGTFRIAGPYTIAAGDYFNDHDGSPANQIQKEAIWYLISVYGVDPADPEGNYTAVTLFRNYMDWCWDEGEPNGVNLGYEYIMCDDAPEGLEHEVYTFQVQRRSPDGSVAYSEEFVHYRD